MSVKSIWQYIKFNYRIMFYIHIWYELLNYAYIYEI
jgi:hypothetical protein